MKINTISAYLLVYLLARGHWNLMVPVRAVEESDVSTGSASADAGSATNGAPESTPLAAPAANGGSTAGTDAGLTSPDASADGAGADGSGTDGSGTDADASAGSPAEGASSGESSTDADAAPASGEAAEAGSSAEAADAGSDAGHVAGGSADAVLLNGLYPDFHTGGMTADEAPLPSPELVAKRKEEAKRLADDMIKSARELMKKAEELSSTIAATTVDLDDLNAKMDAAAYTARVESSQLKESTDPSDMTYYSSFPDGWHKRVDDDVLAKIYDYHKHNNNMMYYSGFPNGWHSEHDPELEKDASLRKTLMHYNGFPDGWHFGDPDMLKEIRRYEIRVEAEAVKAKIEAKKSELDNVKKQIDELTTLFNTLDAEVKKLEEEQLDLEKKLLGLDASLIMLYKADTEGNEVLMEENTDFTKKRAHGDLRYEFKSGVKCIKVTFGAAHVWKKGEREVDEPKLVAFNDTVNVLAVRDETRAVLYKKETNSNVWNHHNTIVRKTAGSSASRTTAQSGTASTLASSSALSASKLNLDTSSTGTPESPDSLNEDDTASVASGGSEGDSGSALRGSSEGSAGEGIANGEYSSVFMD